MANCRQRLLSAAPTSPLSSGPANMLAPYQASVSTNNGENFVVSVTRNVTRAVAWGWLVRIIKLPLFGSVSMAKSCGMTVDQLAVALEEAHQGDAPEVEPLRNVAFNDLLSEINREDQKIPLSITERFLKVLA